MQLAIFPNFIYLLNYIKIRFEASISHRPIWVKATWVFLLSFYQRLQIRLISGGFSSAQTLIYTIPKTHKHTFKGEKTVYTFTVVVHGLLNINHDDVCVFSSQWDYWWRWGKYAHNSLVPWEHLEMIMIWERACRSDWGAGTGSDGGWRGWIDLLP